MTLPDSRRRLFGRPRDSAGATSPTAALAPGAAPATVGIPPSPSRHPVPEPPTHVGATAAHAQAPAPEPQPPVSGFAASAPVRPTPNQAAPDQPQDGPAPLFATVVAPARPLAALLRDIERYASCVPPEGPTQLARVLAAAREDYPGARAAIDQALARGNEAHESLQPFYQLGRRFGVDSPQAQAAATRLQQRRPDLLPRAQRAPQRGAAADGRAQETYRNRQQGCPVSQVQPRPDRAQPTVAPSKAPAGSPAAQPASAPAPAGLRRQDPRGLAPSPQWTLLIDETGVCITGDADQLPPTDWRVGRLVGLLLPLGHRLPQLLRGWHAVNQNTAAINRIVQTILDAPVGVLGISVQQLPVSPMERWSFGVLRLIDLVLRLLAMDGPTTLKVEIEQRESSRTARSGAPSPPVGANPGRPMPHCSLN